MDDRSDGDGKEPKAIQWDGQVARYETSEPLVSSPQPPLSTTPVLPPQVAESIEQRASKPFRFMDLPRDIRIMVYERIPISTKHRRSDTSRAPVPLGPLPLVPCTVDQSISVAILRVSREVHAEAKPVLQKRMELIESNPIRMIIPAEANPFPCLQYCPVRHVFGSYGGVGRARVAHPALLPPDQFIRLAPFLLKAEKRMRAHRVLDPVSHLYMPKIEVAITRGSCETLPDVFRLLFMPLGAAFNNYFWWGVICVRLIGSIQAWGGEGADPEYMCPPATEEGITYHLGRRFNGGFDPGAAPNLMVFLDESISQEEWEAEWVERDFQIGKLY